VTARPAAYQDHDLPGAVALIADDLSHGPLDDGKARIDYMRACFQGYEDWYLEITDAFAPWRMLGARIEDDGIETIFIWVGDNVSEATFLRMACRHKTTCFVTVLWSAGSPQPASGAGWGYFG